MIEQIKSITELPVADIIMRDRMRAVSEAGVASVMKSIEDIGFIKDPIHVRKVKHRGGEYVLMAGAHRLTAAQRLGWESIKVTCWECSDDFAKLMEIDDNLAGAELTALDTAVFLAERRRVYEKLHPEAGRGGARGNQHTGGWQSDIMSFCQSAAEKLGKTERHVRRMASVGEALSRDEISDLRAAAKPIQLNDLIAISKIGDEAERGHVVASLSAGAAKNASSARKSWKAAQGQAPSPLNPADQELVRLLDAWSRGRKAARKRFLEECGDEVRALLAELDAGGEVESDD